MHEILFHERLKGLLRYLAKNNSIQEDRTLWNNCEQKWRKVKTQQLSRIEIRIPDLSLFITAGTKDWTQDHYVEYVPEESCFKHTAVQKNFTCQFPLSKFCSTQTGTVLINQFHLRYEPLRSFGTITSLSLITSFQPPLIAEPLDIECRRRRKLLKNVLPCKHIHSWQL